MGTTSGTSSLTMMRSSSCSVFSIDSGRDVERPDQEGLDSDRDEDRHDEDQDDVADEQFHPARAALLLRDAR